MATLDLQVSASSDDCLDENNPANFSLDLATVRAGDYSAASYDWASGMRFLSVNIPQGMRITAAYLTLRAYDKDGSIPTTIIEGEASDNAITFSDITDYDARVRTSETVDWTPVAWVDNTWYNSPSLVAIIQEIVDRPGWVVNNALVLFWRDAPGDVSPGLLYARSYDGSVTYAPKLHIETAFIPRIMIF